MIPNILGIDLGSSGIKLIYSTEDGNTKVREDYEEISPIGWYQALCRVAKRFDLSQVKAIGLSSQVGTYIINGKDNISWSAQIGQEELEEVLGMESQEVFLKEISMPHPHILSYPLPRLSYIKKKYEALTDVCMPKDFLIEKLTGNRVSDPFSWRGLANLETGQYSSYLLEKIGVSEAILPQLQKPDSIAGYITQQASEETGIPVGTPVYVGCNDFFAGLLGMGMIHSGSMFDITGTSEHLGLITDTEPDLHTSVVHGPYFRHHALYGVTASSGASLKFGKGLWNLNDKTLLSCAKKKFTDRTIIDTVARNAREPQRKLKAGERIMGPLVLLDQYGADTSVLIKTAAAMLLYDNDGEDKWREIVKNNTPAEILESIGGLAQGSKLSNAILAEYEALKHK